MLLYTSYMVYLSTNWTYQRVAYASPCLARAARCAAARLADLIAPAPADHLRSEGATRTTSRRAAQPAAARRLTNQWSAAPRADPSSRRSLTLVVPTVPTSAQERQKVVVGDDWSNSALPLQDRANRGSDAHTTCRYGGKAFQQPAHVRSHGPARHRHAWAADTTKKCSHLMRLR